MIQFGQSYQFGPTHKVRSWPMWVLTHRTKKPFIKEAYKGQKPHKNPVGQDPLMGFLLKHEKYIYFFKKIIKLSVIQVVRSSQANLYRSSGWSGLSDSLCLLDLTRSTCRACQSRRPWTVYTGSLGWPSPFWSSGSLDPFGSSDSLDLFGLLGPPSPFVSLGLPEPFRSLGPTDSSKSSGLPNPSDHRAHPTLQGLQTFLVRTGFWARPIRV